MNATMEATMDGELKGLITIRGRLKSVRNRQTDRRRDIDRDRPRQRRERQREPETKTDR